ncbi:hypothetical protein M2318_003867 [Metapseudomonas resinovorans]
MRSMADGFSLATLAASRLFQPSSASRTLRMAVSRVKGGTGGRTSDVDMAVAPGGEGEWGMALLSWPIKRDSGEWSGGRSFAMLATRSRGDLPIHASTLQRDWQGAQAGRPTAVAEGSPPIPLHQRPATRLASRPTTGAGPFPSYGKLFCSSRSSSLKIKDQGKWGALGLRWYGAADQHVVAVRQLRRWIGVMHRATDQPGGAGSA